MSIRLLHTSDVHLGATFKVLGERGREQHRQVRETFARVAGLAIEERVDAVLIAGDLFDSVAAARVQAPFAAEQLGRLGEAGIPVVLIAGNHDPLGEGSASVWADLTARCPHLSVLGPALETRAFPELDLTVVGRSVADRLSAESPLTGLPVPRRTHFLVALAHGSVQRPDLPARFGLITPEEIAASGVDYLALGDWHSTRDVSSGGVRAWYSGAPEMIGLDEPDCGSVCLVTLGAPGDIEVVRRPVGRRRGRHITLDLAGSGGAEGVARAIRGHADASLALVVTLGGLVGLADRVNVERLREDLGPEFFRLEIRDESHLRLDAVDPSLYPEGTVLGGFVRAMQEQIAGREGEARAIAEDALQWGVALLEGKEVLT
ncbi:MAG: DNA repair exonuclease [Bacillati bacterium ANGP1]|uniref:DNA repair exonuclease n=1 Tax=Candidatus Segetimicrobium genomatis TaxID=2569760 RepID=A0A537K262_9BACT|nr:MAG: DNA repair exonuclease [Terrabacteria group bacterium ANGP1]